VHIVYTLHVYIVSYSCMLTQLYDDLLRVKLVNLNDDLLHTLAPWQIFDTRSYTGFCNVIFANFVVMFSFKLMYGIFYGIYRLLLLVVRRHDALF